MKDGQINHNSEIFINDEFYEKQKDKWLHTGDMVMVQSGHVGHAAVIPEELDKSAAHALIMFRNPKIKIEPYFLNYQYQTLKSKKKIDNITTGNTIKHILASDMQEFIVDVTSYKEQSKIASVFRNFDSLITLHQREYIRPTLIFKIPIDNDFALSWEQRKFSDFTFPAGERNKDDLDLEPFAITNNQGFIAQSEAHDDFGYMKDVDRKMYIVVKPNSFAYNPARINVGSLGYYEGEENVIVSSLYEVFQTAEYVDDKFLKHWFKTKAFQDWIERLQEGSVRLYFYYDKLCECIMSMPSVEEQRKIGAYLDKIDNLITLHQRERGNIEEKQRT